MLRRRPHAFDCHECETHAKFVAKHPPARPEEAGEEILGMAFPLDRLYHRGHAWMRREPDGAVTVGLDDLGRRLLGSPDSVSLPEPGQRVTANATAWRAHKRNAEVRVLSPVDGEVLETGDAGPTLADGGTPVADIAAAYPDADCGEMFLNP
jgi:hypothetical protein